MGVSLPHGDAGETNNTQNNAKSTDGIRAAAPATTPQR
jgi:hypothetical protein